MEVIVYICSFLDFDNIRKLPHLHPIFNRITTESQVWKDLKLVGNSVDFEVLQAYLDQFNKHINSLHVSGLQTIEFDGNDSFQPDLSHVIHACFALRSITVEDSGLFNEHCQIYDELRMRIKILRLRRLTNVLPNTLPNRHLFNNRAFAKMLSTFEGLRTLEITGTASVKSLNVQRSVTGMCMLEYLNVEGSAYLSVERVIKIMSSCPKIKVFRFTHYRYLNCIALRQKSMRKWYHLTKLYYPWIQFSKTLTCDVHSYLTTRKSSKTN